MTAETSRISWADYSQWGHSPALGGSRVAGFGDRGGGCVAKPCGTNFDASSAAAQIITPNRFAALLIRNVTANGGHVGLLVNDNVSNPASGLMIYDVTTTGFKFPVNIS